jgi:FkbM family methyltransferase
MHQIDGLIAGVAKSYRNNWKKLLGQKLSMSNKIVLVGSGGNAARVLRFFDSIKHRPQFYLPISEADHSRSIDGFNTIALKDIQGWNAKEALFVFSTPCTNTMSQLREMGHQYLDSSCMEFPSMFEPEIIMENLDEIVTAFKTLHDRESRQVFQSVLEYRLTADPLRLRPSYWQQYFHPLVRPFRGDIIVDGGAFIGDTAESFLKALSCDCVICSFEPDTRNFAQLKSLIDTKKEYKDALIPVHAGLWNGEGQLEFSSAGSASRLLPSLGNVGNDDNSISVIDLDTFFEKRGIRPSLIKLDIETAEYKALEGAKKIIGENLPRLQVCVYHTPMDLWKIPLLIERMELKYRLFLGHHTNNYCETVLYAVSGK